MTYNKLKQFNNNSLGSLDKTGIKFLCFSFLTFLFSSCTTAQLVKPKTDLEIMNLRGKVRNIKWYADTALQSETVYNQKGFRTTSTYFYPNGSVLNIISYKYDDKGNLVEEVSNYSEDKVYKTFYEYDSRNRNVKKTEIYPDNTIHFVMKFEYDNNNKVSKVEYIPKNGPGYCYTFENGKDFRKEIHCTYGLQYLYKLDKELIIEKAEYNSSGIKKLNYKYQYNQFSDRTTETTFNGESEIEEITFSYTYDTLNNWLQNTALYSSGGKSKTVRIITYYE